MTNIPNFKKGTGKIATDRYDFEAHLNGTNPDSGSHYVKGFRHTANQVDINNPSLVYGSPTTVESALENISDYIDLNSGSEQGFLTIGDGYNSWHNANGIINFDSSIPSIDTILNPIFATIYAGTGILPEYKRLQYGGVVFIKAGTYTVKDTILVPPGITIIGEGYGTKFINTTGLLIPAFGIAPSYRENYTISTATPTTPIQITTTIATTLVTGEKVVITNIAGVSGASGVFTITVIDSANFTLNESVGGGTYINGGTVSFARPVFQVLVDQNRISNDQVVDPNTFMFARATKFINLVIADNFVEAPMLGDTYFVLPQNRNSDSPLISQLQGSNLEVLNTYFIGRANFSSGTIVSNVTSHAIKLDLNSNTNGTFLKINDCFMDGFAIPIMFKSSGGSKDTIQVVNNKIRAHGYYGANGSVASANNIITMNDNNASITSNYFYGNHALLNTIIFISGVIASTPTLQAYSRILIASNSITINKSGSSSIVLDLLGFEAGVSTNILTRATSLMYGNVFEDSNFKIETFKGTALDVTYDRTYMTGGIKNDIKTISDGYYTVDSISPDHTLLVKTLASAKYITLPPHDFGRRLTIMDIEGKASTNNITVIRNGGLGKINNYSTSMIMSTAAQAQTLMSNGIDWFTVSTNSGISLLTKVGYRDGAVGGGTAGTSNRTAVINAFANDLLIVFCTASANTNASPTCSDNNSGGTYYLIGTASISFGTSTMSAFVRTSLIVSAFPTTVTVATGSNDSAEIAIIAVAGMLPSAVGSAAIRQFATQINQINSVPAPTFSSAALTNNMTIGAIGSVFGSAVKKYYLTSNASRNGQLQLMTEVAPVESPTSYSKWYADAATPDGVLDLSGNTDTGTSVHIPGSLLFPMGSLPPSAFVAGPFTGTFAAGTYSVSTSGLISGTLNWSTIFMEVYKGSDPSGAGATGIVGSNHPNPFSISPTTPIIINSTLSGGVTLTNEYLFVRIFLEYTNGPTTYADLTLYANTAYTFLTTPMFTDTSGSNPVTISPPASWTEVQEDKQDVPPVGTEVVTRDDGFAGTQITWGSTQALYAAIILELNS